MHYDTPLRMMWQHLLVFHQSAGWVAIVFDSASVEVCDLAGLQERRQDAGFAARLPQHEIALIAFFSPTKS